MFNPNRKLPIVGLAIISMIFTTACGGLKLEEKNWNKDVKTAIEDFVSEYGNTSSKYDENSYVVFDFDNTCSIFDMSEQLMIFQMENMAFAFTPEELPDILASGLGDMNNDLTELGYGKGSYNDWISDITIAYEYLYNTYGPFDANGVDSKTAKVIQNDPMWLEYAVKMMNMYYLICDNESTEISYPWITYWYTGMTDNQVYNLACKSHEKYSIVETSYKTLKTSSEVNSKVGVSEYTYVEGVQVTENIVELWKVLSQSGIDVWVCTASESNIIRAAIDTFGMHDYCTGLIGMTPKQENGRLSYEYDYDTGYAWIAEENGKWSRGNVASKAQTQGIGKSIAVENILVSKYGCGPLAGFMDSTGDFNFCTEFKNLKLVVCFNRADRNVTDGGGLIAELAVYQKDTLGYDLEKANSAGDTLYVLQGRDENGFRRLRSDSTTIKLDEKDSRLFSSEKNTNQLKYMQDNKMSTQEILNRFAIKTSMDSKDNELGFAYGFLDSYKGYHSR